MRYRIDDAEKEIEGSMAERSGDNEYTVLIGGEERSLKILSMDARGIEFVLDHNYHRAKYLRSSINRMDIVVDNTPISLSMHAHLDDIVYKNSGGGGASSTDTGLKSQIPGKVVSITVSEGDSVGKGDTICVLESMKMQVAVKAHRAGSVTALRIKDGVTVAKGDVIADIE